jgi:hypothetical protein
MEPPTSPRSSSVSRASPTRWQNSELSETTAQAQGNSATDPGTAARTADPHPEITLQPPPAGTTTAVPLRLEVFQFVHDRSHSGTKQQAGGTPFGVAMHTEGLPQMGTGLPVLPGLKSLRPHSYLCGRLHAAGSPFSARPFEPCGPIRTYYLTADDCFTRWPEAVPIPDSRARALLTGWISSFGSPIPSPLSQLCHSLAKLCEIQIYDSIGHCKQPSCSTRTKG